LEIIFSFHVRHEVVRLTKFLGYQEEVEALNSFHQKQISQRSV